MAGGIFMLLRCRNKGGGSDGNICTDYGDHMLHNYCIVLAVKKIGGDPNYLPLRRRVMRLIFVSEDLKLRGDTG